MKFLGLQCALMCALMLPAHAAVIDGVMSGATTIQQAKAVADTMASSLGSGYMPIDSPAARSDRAVGLTSIAHPLGETGASLWVAASAGGIVQYVRLCIRCNRALKDLERAYANFFAKRANVPRFKKKGQHDSFRYPDPKLIRKDQDRQQLRKLLLAGAASAPAAPADASYFEGL